MGSMRQEDTLQGEQQGTQSEKSNNKSGFSLKSLRKKQPKAMKDNGAAEAGKQADQPSANKIKNLLKIKTKAVSKEGAEGESKRFRLQLNHWGPALRNLKNLEAQNFHPGKSVGIRLFLIFFVSILLFVVGLGVMSYNMAKNTIENNAASAYQETLSQTASKLSLILGRFEDISTQTLFDDELSTQMTQLTNNTNLSAYDSFSIIADINKRLQNIAFTNKSIESIYLVSSDAEKPILGSGSVTGAEGIRDQAWFSELVGKNGIQWIPTAADQKTDPTFKLARSMNTVTGKKTGYVMIFNLKLSVLEEQLSGIDLGEGSMLNVITREGGIVASNTPGTAGKNNKEIPVQTMTEEKGNSKLTADVGSGSNEYLSVYNQMGTSPWIVTGLVATSELTKDVKGILWTTWIAVGVAIVLAVLIGLWMVRMIAKPLVVLKDLMMQGAKGNLNVRTSHNSSDEIGLLSASFNEMMEQITELVKQTNSSAQEVLDTANELGDASKKTAISAREIAVATEEIANGASSLAMEAEKGSSYTDSIARQVQNVVTSNEEMGQAARNVEQVSENGARQLVELMGQTQETENMTRNLVRKVDSLKETTSSVFRVLEVLQNITKQTNILSLNATIEAARAGQAGKGFMVVADEIRQLADQSRQSILMVGSITDNIISEMNETVDVLSEAYPLFQKQIHSVNSTGEIFQSVQEQMRDFVGRLDSVTESIRELDESQVTLSEAMTNVSAVAEESSATSQEVASLSNEQQHVGNQLVQLSDKLQNVSNGLRETLTRFTL
ncbi:methyl-accepting chemotaxis protein [Paenibacillus sp. JX-17]|uniref:Methyl-accepting chemotaxis protein n=1 Tax=Paenibacillus lacisoli TaxID=3064525 RepID=A0ABT9CHS5_9BACL|nr:methyl-accepting chemotaxis protein [Paenibacillus sp. JX-17]MDO7908123.1 methyl-accepting chemotaxis protein [Paenibacillus sp. JX-17]